MRNRILGLLLASAVGLLTASPAAAITVQRQESTGPPTSQNKSTTVSCPAGTRVTGAGGRINGAVGQVVLDDVRPDAGLTSVTVNALEDGTGTSADWSLTAYALCTTAPSGVERVSRTSPLDSTAGKSVTVPCPAGKKVLGTGADVNTFNGQILLDGLRPSGDLQSVTVNALEDEDGNTAAWSVTAYAICGDPIVGLRLQAGGAANQCASGERLLGIGGEINSAAGQTLLYAIEPQSGAFVEAAEDETGDPSGFNLTAYSVCARGLDPIPAVAQSVTSSSNKSATVTCPFGRRVSGVGGRIVTSAEPFSTGEVLIDDLRPSADLTSVTVNALEDENGFAGDWRVAAYAVCVNPPPGLERVSATSPLNSSSKSVTASCPAGKRVLGVGGDVNTFNGQVLLDALRPDAGLTGVTMAGNEDETGNPAAWSLTAYAVCASYAGLERATADSGLSSQDKGAAAQCPGGKQVLSVGGDINTLNAQVALSAFTPFEIAFPEPGTTEGSASGAEDETGNPVNWAIVADVVCAGP